VSIPDHAHDRIKRDPSDEADSKRDGDDGERQALEGEKHGEPLLDRRRPCKRGRLSSLTGKVYEHAICVRGSSSRLAGSAVLV
jgi:hypothetical protein